jgi:hypothetical protein
LPHCDIFESAPVFKCVSRFTSGDLGVSPGIQAAFQADFAASWAKVARRMGAIH